MRLYRFLSEKWALAAISERRLKIARINQLNDPFELLGLNLQDKRLRRAMKKVKEHLNEMHGLLCFSRRWVNPVLWSHYADAHRGICLGFDVQAAHPITYDAERVMPEDGWLLNDQPQKIEDMKLFLYTKFKHWHYEEEMRVACALDEKDPDGHYYKEFGPELKLAEVVVGANSELPSNQLVDAVRGFENKIQLTKARLAFRSFKVVTDQRGLH